MSTLPPLPAVPTLAAAVADLLKARKQTIAVAEASCGGLISAALLAVPGASAYFLGGAVVYTAKARIALLQIPAEAMQGMRASTEAYASLLATTARQRFGSDWAVAESGATGPTGNRYGDAAGHVCIAVAGAVESAITHETARHERAGNMQTFAALALAQLLRALEGAPPAAE
jgi:PncC family amidohydrolase